MACCWGGVGWGGVVLCGCRWEVEVTAASSSYLPSSLSVMGPRGHKLQPLFNLLFRRSSIQHPLLTGGLSECRGQQGLPEQRTATVPQPPTSASITSFVVAATMSLLWPRLTVPQGFAGLVPHKQSDHPEVKQKQRKDSTLKT
jgi:hypothetical protein